MLLHMLALASVAPKAHSVVFAYTDSKAKSVQIAGDFNAWSKPFEMTKKGGNWTKAFTLPDNGRIEYKFVVDGQWILDPTNPHRIDNGLGQQNTVWAGSAYKSAVRDQAPKTPLKRTEIQVGGRTIVIFAPKQSRGLPILTYGDGPNYENPGKIQNIVENLVEANRIRPVVIALVPPIDRLKEYGADWKPYGEYLLNQVIPAVRKATGASPLGKNLFVGGSSMGGLISLRLAEEFPDKVAGGVHCQSAAFQWTPLKLKNDEVIQPVKLAKLNRNLKVWLDWGTFEDALMSSNVQAAGLLQAVHHPFGSQTTPEGHNWTAWRNRMEPGLIYLLGK